MTTTTNNTELEALRAREKEQDITVMRLMYIIGWREACIHYRVDAGTDADIQARADAAISRIGAE